MNIARFKELFDCDLERGVLIRKVRVANQIAGKEAGSTRPDGYVRVGVDGKDYLVHRIVWLFAHNEWPEYELDHIDGNPSNNALSNLRPATHAENHQNQKVHKRNKTGVSGVSPSLRNFRVRVGVGMREIYVGSFATLEEAIEARDKAKAELHVFNPIQRVN